MHPIWPLIAALLGLVGPRPAATPAPPELPPNVIVIVSDDAGYADFGMHGCADIDTPRIDAIARGGVRFAQGYVSASVCSPSRAGLLTGRYQQRFGHELNIPPRFSTINGLPLTETLMPELLRRDGYRTIALGKWHLGYADHFHPCRRGFDDFFGFLQGSRPYWAREGTRLNRLLRDESPIPETFEYLTDALGTEAARYITRHRDRPFFLYLSFTAVHTPMHVTPAALADVPRDLPTRRRKLVAMTHAMDNAVGEVLDAVEREGLEERTLVFFVNDNGGATNNASRNLPLRGKKGSPFEGGIRVPFVVRWPGVFPAGLVYDFPVSTLDILPTALAAAGSQMPPPKPLDGVNLIPFLTGSNQDRPHSTLFWRRAGNLAVREGDWKLVQTRDEGPLLFDLARDPDEATDLSAQEPGKLAHLRSLHETWAKEMESPRWGRGRRQK